MLPLEPRRLIYADPSDMTYLEESARRLLMGQRTERVGARRGLFAFRKRRQTKVARSYEHNERASGRAPLRRRISGILLIRVFGNFSSIPFGKQISPERSLRMYGPQPRTRKLPMTQSVPHARGFRAETSLRSEILETVPTVSNPVPG